MKKILLNTTEVTFKGHIVHCIDQDSRDEFNVEVLINANCSEDKLIDACEIAAKKNDLVTLSGNSFEFDYVQPSGRVILKSIARYELSPIDKESEDMLGQFNHG